MSNPFHIRGALEFASEATLSKARTALAAAEWDHAGVHVAGEMLPIGGALVIDFSGSMPASSWEPTLLVLEAAAAFARSGQIECTLFIGDQRDVSYVRARRGGRKKAPPGEPPPMPSDSEIAGRCASTDYLRRHFEKARPDAAERGKLLWEALRQTPWRARDYARVLDALAAASFTTSDLVVLLRELAAGNAPALETAGGSLHTIAWSSGLEALVAPHVHDAELVALAKTIEGPFGDALRWTLARHRVLPATVVAAELLDESARIWSLTRHFHGASALAPEPEWARKVIDLALSERGFASADELGALLDHATPSERIELGMRCYCVSEGRRALVAVGRAKALAVLDAADPAARAVFANPNDTALLRRALIAWLALFDLTDARGFGPFEQWHGFLTTVEASLEAVCNHDREEIEHVRAAINASRRAAST